MEFGPLVTKRALCLVVAPLCVLVILLFGGAALWPRRKLPDCLIIGVKKAGTRALLEFANLHPDVVRAPKEIDFFSIDGDYAKGLSWYRAHLPLAEKGQLTLEKSPSYFNSKKTPKRIFEVNKDMKIILAVREPVERAVSDFLQSSRKKRTNMSFESMAFLDDSMQKVNRRWRAIELSQYGVHMTEWLRVFPLEQILVVDNAALVADPATQMRRVEEFLGLRPFFTNETFYFEPRKGFMCIRDEGLNIDFLSYALEKYQDGGVCMTGPKGRKHPPLHPQALNTLRRHYAPSNRIFNAQIDQNFNWPVE